MAENVYTYCPRCATPLAETFVYNALRATCPQCNFILFLEPKVVTVVVIQRGDTVLLGRRNMEPARGMWSFVSGYVDRGEKVEEAAIREVKEETNLDVQLDKLLGVFSEQGNPHVVIAYCANIKHNDISGLTAQLDEVSELAFFPLDCLPELAFPADKHILHTLQNQS
jgi:8-oxo-dGTP diphosphatase